MDFATCGHEQVAPARREDDGMSRRKRVEDFPENLEDLLERLGGVPLRRIRSWPPPGTATEADVLAAEREPRKVLCELIDGVLVEKARGTKEAILASLLGHFLWEFVRPRQLGVVLGADGMLRLFPGRVRIPDVSFISADRLPAGEFPTDAIAELSPNLAVEVLSKSNTAKEIELKLRDYFQSGSQLVWIIQPKTQTAVAYTSSEDKRRVGKNQALDGGAVLPGFKLPLKSLFAPPWRKHAG
jgi:Uma2 family endonuclease